MPDLVTKIHEEYLRAGSDIIETNTFNGTAISQGEYQFQEIVYEINKRGAELAKAACAVVTKEDPSKPRFVAGAIGPTSRTLSVSPSVEDCSFRNVTWDELVESYVEQISGTIVDQSGRTLSGQTIEAFFVSISHSKPLTVGINCALGAGLMKQFYKKLVDICPGWCHVYPNAGLPNAMGGYDETPETFGANL